MAAGAAWQAAEEGEPRIGEANVKTFKVLANIHDVPFGQHVFGCLNLIVLTVNLCQAFPMTFAERCSEVGDTSWRV